MVNAAPSRSICPIATSLEQVGDRWSLVIIRDMLTGKARYNEFLASPERITTNILASRLTALEACGIVERRPYKERPPRFEYHLTEKGRGLIPVLQAFCAWGNRYMPETGRPPESFMALQAPDGKDT